MGGFAAKGTTLKKGTTAIGSLTKIDGPALKADTIDVTTHDSPSAYREFVGGLKEAGEIKLEGNFTNDAGQQALSTDFESGAVETYTITFPTVPATTWTFSGVVVGFETSAPMEGKIEFSSTIKVSGKATLASAGA